MGWLRTRGSAGAQPPGVDTTDLAKQKRRRQEHDRDLWLQARRSALSDVRTAESTYRSAKKVYDLYAPGPKKDAAAGAVDRAADMMLAAQHRLRQVEDFSTWKKSVGR